jgi:2-amino-4-hydroxy-6-hydroxymethyldihydropteridine diphosphokinase
MAIGRLALIALGSNVGHPTENLRRAIDEFTKPGSGIETVRVSRFIETAPVGGPSGQSPYVNAVASVMTRLQPIELLARLKSIELHSGRVDGPVWGARALDLDILAHDHLTLRTPSLVVPHPRMTVRRFVLDPLAEIAPDWIHPQLGWSIRAILAHLDQSRPIVAFGDSFARFAPHFSKVTIEPWQYVRHSPEAMFQVDLLSRFDPEQLWDRPKFYPSSDEIGPAFDQVLATCASLRPMGSAGSN